MSRRQARPRRVYLLRRVLVLFILLALAGLAFSLWLVRGTITKPGEEIPAAPLQIVEWMVEDGEVAVAAYIPEGISEEEARQGILNIYEWSQKYHPAVNCGPGTEEDCSVGSTTIILLSSSGVRLVSGQVAKGYVTTAQMELNQFLIAQLLTRPPATFDDLISWHSFAQNVGAGSFENLSGQPFLQLMSAEESTGG